MKTTYLIYLLPLIGLFILSCNSVNDKNSESPNLMVSNTADKMIDSIRPITSKNHVLGKFDYKSDSSFVKVSPEYTVKDIYLNKETYSAFVAMADSAKKSGISLKILSGTRNFNEQKAIWERKWKRYKDLVPLDRTKKILEYSAMPSSSRHHWGTDIDFNSLNNSYFNTGKGLKEYYWLLKHANSFGFYQVYDDQSSGRKGYHLEKWHWSYLPLAKSYLKFYNNNVDLNDIVGFSGSKFAKNVNIIESYVNGISTKSKKIN